MKTDNMVSSLFDFTEKMIDVTLGDESKATMKSKIATGIKALDAGANKMTELLNKYTPEEAKKKENKEEGQDEAKP